MLTIQPETWSWNIIRITD